MDHRFQKQTVIAEQIKIDQAKGLGQVPFNLDIGYFGFVAMMKPSAFLSLAPSMGDETSSFVKDRLAAGAAIASPLLGVEFDTEKGVVRIDAHEGRHRMEGIRSLVGDEEIPVHIFPRGGLRARNMTAEMIELFRDGAWSEAGPMSPSVFREGPLFGDVLLCDRVLPAEPYFTASPGM